ncbi:MAG: DUF2793 domain-containing protein [Pseudomonadota bacterium]
MSETTRLGLKLLQASQAQKHVTVNEALSRIDAVSQLVLASRSVSVPPSGAAEGSTYGVPSGAVNEWSGRDGAVAVAANGGWEFIEPARGWQAWITDEGARAVHDGTLWVSGAVTQTEAGSGAMIRTIEFDHVLGAGAFSTTNAIIPADCLLLAITGRVTVAITGAATAWQLGIDGVSADRYGSGLGVAAGSFVRGVTASPQAYYAPTPLTLTATGGDFAGGSVRLAVHLVEFAIPIST